MKTDQNTTPEQAAQAVDFQPGNPVATVMPSQNSTPADAEIARLAAELDALDPDHVLFEQHALRSPEQTLIRKLSKAVDEAKTRQQYLARAKAQREANESHQRDVWSRIVPDSVPKADESLLGRRFKLVEIIEPAT